MDGAGLLESFVGGQLVTAADGTFVVAGLVPNVPVTLHAERGGRLTNRVMIEVDAGTVRSGIVLRLP